MILSNELTFAGRLDEQTVSLGSLWFQGDVMVGSRPGDVVRLLVVVVTVVQGRLTSVVVPRRDVVSAPLAVSLSQHNPHTNRRGFVQPLPAHYSRVTLG